MHLEADGLLRQEAYYMVYSLTRSKDAPQFTLQELNRRIKGAPKHLWADGVRLPSIHRSKLHGTKGGKPKSGGTLGYTAHEMSQFALARCVKMPAHFARGCGVMCWVLLAGSEQLFNDLVPAGNKIWECWLAHVAYFRMMLEDEFTAAEVLKVDEAIYHHQCLFSCVPEYGYGSLTKPKHHQAQHLAQDILRFGPPRGVWCMSYEGFHQLLKRATRISNFKTVCKTLCKHWSLRFAFHLAFQSEPGML